MTQTLMFDSRPETATTVVEIVIPVYNEEGDLEESVRRLRTYLDESFPFPTVITVADNASTDRTWDIASWLARTLPGVQALHLNQNGKGRALRAAWLASDAEIVAYMDADLSTDLDALLPLVAPLLSGHSHVAIGSRLASGSRVVRGAKREMISRTYNLLLHTALRNRFSDAQCGFKALRRETAVALLPFVQDNQWFFDTELLVLAERSGLRIHEVPVDWIDDPDSRVHIAQAMSADLKGIWRLVRHQSPEAPELPELRLLESSKNSKLSGMLTSYAGIGVTSTITYLVLYLLLRNVLAIYGANVLAFGVSTIMSTIGHAQFGSGPKNALSRRVAILAGAASFLSGVGLTTLTLSLDTLLGTTSPLAEALAIIAGTGAAALVRFALLQSWMFRAHFRATSPHESTPTAAATPAPAEIWV
jgi:glycosyltransferase involved in cell wall biosynthesis